MKYKFNNPFPDLARNIVQQVENYAQHQKAHSEHGRKDTSFSTAINEMNKNVLNTMDEINKIIQNSDMPEDIFIYDESLKMYITAETKNTNAFHGRELQIFSALDQLYSMNGIKELVLPQSDVLYSIALNLSSLAVGKEVKDDVANYLSIFAGMLMFDDLQNMANDIAHNAVQDIQTQAAAARKIHLYLINDVYYPGSLVLTMVANALEQGYRQISAERAAKITINTSGADKEIATYVKEHYQSDTDNKKYDPSDWDTEADLAQQGTSIQITFLASFVQLLKYIQDYMQ